MPATTARTATTSARRSVWWAAAVVLALGLSGCAQSTAEPSVASAGPSTSAGSTADAGAADANQRYADCLTEAGVTLLPATDGPPQVDKARTPLATIAAASETCRSLAPVVTAPERISQSDLEARRAYSVCVRANGVGYFPDPDPATGEPVLDDATALRLKSDPAFAAAQEACRAGLPGATDSDVLTGGGR